VFARSALANRASPLQHLLHPKRTKKQMKMTMWSLPAYSLLKTGPALDESAALIETLPGSVRSLVLSLLVLLGAGVVLDSLGEREET
jgi:hypothetical protein